MLSRVPALKFPFRMWRGRGVESAARTGRARDRPRYIAPVLASSGLWILAASLVFFAGALSALPAPARASPLFPICTDHPRGYDPFKAADVVAEGVLLSGPSFHGALLSPARFHVVRYLKDRGPRVIRIRTPQRQVATDTVRYLGDGQYGIVPEFARIPDNAQTPRAGEAYRIFARTRRRHGKRREVMHRIDTCTGDDRRISIRRLLRPVPRTLVRRRGGRELWSASLYRRRGRPHCLRLFHEGLGPSRVPFRPSRPWGLRVPAEASRHAHRCGHREFGDWRRTCRERLARVHRLAPVRWGQCRRDRARRRRARPSASRARAKGNRHHRPLSRRLDSHVREL